MTGLVLSREFTRHQTDPGHPECPERITAIDRSLRANGLADRCVMIDDGPDPWPWIRTNHDDRYITRFIDACARGADSVDSPDCSICPESAEVAALAARRVLGALDRVMSGEVLNAFCVVRPPGHHAERDRALGFCYFNNVAVLARYARAHHEIKKVLILDWDVHHGNGTQHSFEDDPSVYYVSLHGHPATLYPGTGWAEERGKGDGFGYTLNIPLLPGSMEREYREAFESQILPEVNRFAPELVVVSAGFDAHKNDPIGNQRLETESFRWLSEELLRIADKWAKGRLVSVLEGGYDLHALGESCRVHLETLLTWPQSRR